MNFIEALRYQKEYGTPIRRAPQIVFGIIIQVRDSGYNSTRICKFVDSKNVYTLDLEDILATDWEIQPEIPLEKK